MEIFAQAFALCILVCLCVGLKYNFSKIPVSHRIWLFVGILVGLPHSLAAQSQALSLSGSFTGWLIVAGLVKALTFSAKKTETVFHPSHKPTNGKALKPTMIIGIEEVEH